MNIITLCPFCNLKLKDTFLGEEDAPDEYRRYSCEHCKPSSLYASFNKFSVFYESETNALVKVVVSMDNFRISTTYAGCPFDYAHTELFINGHNNRIVTEPIDIPLNEDKLRELIKTMRVFA
jgi:hypothetical protein